ncbi:MAG: tRNA 2-selenouridine(34) synthase MnmH, partial [Hydrogenophaga sp.]|nr:tRNA 2-selenouridine(34) synthase MnmH [Hydrogenophaga sp.]
MPVHTLPASEALSQLDRFDAIIDARTEDEHALDHVPGALNWPTLNNAERITIGTMYKQVNAFEAKKRGAALSARNIAAHIERDVLDKPRDWKPVVYCWRGGNRSGALATILGAIGFQVTLIEGGYKAWRAALVESLPGLATRLHYRVVCGPTGSGKTRLLQALADQGAQVLDLEALANHRSSVLGHIPGVPQPSQKRFDSLIWDALRRFDLARPVFIESESKKVGNVRVPDALIDAMRASPCIDLQLSDEERVALLLEDYDFFVQDSAHFCQRLEALTELRGKAVV